MYVYSIILGKFLSFDHEIQLKSRPMKTLSIAEIQAVYRALVFDETLLQRIRSMCKQRTPFIKTSFRLASNITGKY